MRLASVLLVALALTGCAPLEEKDAAICRADGFVDGSPDFATCLHTHDQQRRMARTLDAARDAEGSSSVASLIIIHR